MVAQPYSSVETPLDRALLLYIAEDWEGALQWSAALAKANQRSAVALLLASAVMGKLGATQAAIAGLEVSVTRAIDDAHLALAVVACREIEALGGDAAARMDAIAATFCAGSPRLLDAGAAPPPSLGDRSVELAPLTEVGDQLTARSAVILREAADSLREDADARDSAPRVPPQPLFSALDRDALRAVIGGFHVRVVASGDVLVEEGTPGTSAFVVARGELEVQRATDTDDPIRLARLGADALFGEMALLSRAPRAASVVACRPSIVLVEEKEALDAIAAQVPAVGRVLAEHCHRRMVDNLVRTSAILRAVTPSERPQLIEKFVTRTFERSQKLIEQGQESAGLHLVASGEIVVVHRDGDESTVVATLGPGEVVGEVALVLRRPSNADVVADTPTVTLHLPRDEFLGVVKKHPALLAELYELAVKRDEETSSIVAQEATDVEDLILI